MLCFVLCTAQAQDFDRLYEDSVKVELARPLEWIAAPKGSVSSPEVFENPESLDNQGFQPYTSDTVLPTSDKQEAWARFALPSTETPQTWFIRVPRQTIVKVSLFARDSMGQWHSQSAGELIPPADWALPTRVPSFELQTRSDGTRVYYLRFEHRSAITERPMLVSPIEYINGASRVGVVIGLMFGMFGLLAMASMTAFAISRKMVFVWFGSFVMALMFTQLVLIGYGSWRLWPHSAHLNQVMAWVATALAMASGTWFCAQASYAHDGHPWVYRLLITVAAVSLMMAGLMLVRQDFLPRDWRNLWMILSTTAVICSLVWMSLRGQTWNRLLLLGAAPIGLATLGRVFYNLGWIRNVELAQAAGVLTAQIGLLWIFLALAWRSREALLSSERDSALASYDPVTGLMLPQAIDARLPGMLMRASRNKSGCGVLMLRWLDNAPVHGLQNIEKRSAALNIIGDIMRKAARDVDTVVRYNHELLVMLVDGPISRNAVSDISTQILASCIRTAEQLGDPNALNLHIAIWHDHPANMSAAVVMDILKTRLHQMSHGTRRPVQFADSAADASNHPWQDSVQRKENLLAKINAIETAGVASAKTGSRVRR
ncbi:MAG: 7TM diverse intracellular signaling domain-containing protein [Pseudomonadota bacterium]